MALLTLQYTVDKPPEFAIILAFLAGCVELAMGILKLGKQIMQISFFFFFVLCFSRLNSIICDWMTNILNEYEFIVNTYIMSKGLRKSFRCYHSIVSPLLLWYFCLTTNRWVILDRNEQRFVLCCFHDPRSLLNTLQLHNCKSTIGNAIKLNILQRFLIKMHVWREVIVWPVGFP